MKLYQHTLMVFCVMLFTVHQAMAVEASGGRMTNYWDASGTKWRAHIFETVGANTLVVSAPGEFEYLIVGGGGGGGNSSGGCAGGGGAGGFREGTVEILEAGEKSVVVGAGGSANNNGQDSSFTPNGTVLTALGGWPWRL